jgi:hypothetical protein
MNNCLHGWQSNIRGCGSGAAEGDDTPPSTQKAGAALSPYPSAPVGWLCVTVRGGWLGGLVAAALPQRTRVEPDAAGLPGVGLTHVPALPGRHRPRRRRRGSRRWLDVVTPLCNTQRSIHSYAPFGWLAGCLLAPPGRPGRPRTHWLAGRLVVAISAPPSSCLLIPLSSL